MKRKTPSTSLSSANQTIRHLAFDLREVYELLDSLCSQLAGGGIVQARDIEPAVAKAMPKVKRAVNALNALNVITDDELGKNDDGDAGSPGQSPLLM
jgi:hypothetical protein